MESKYTPNWVRNIPKCFPAEETLFVNWGSLYARLNSHYEAWSHKKKKHEKVKVYRKSVYKEPNSILKATKIIRQRKGFYRQKIIPESSCARKKTIDIETLVTSRNGGRKIMQSIRIRSRPHSRIRKWNQFRQFSWTPTKVIPIEKTSTMRQW